jgi:dihydroorotase
MELLIKGARIVDHAQDFIGDIYINNGIITEIGYGIEKDCAVVKADGLTLLPSFVDLHAHFRDPGLTHKEDLLTGSQAAVRGGYTAVNLMANTRPVCSSLDIADYVTKKGKEIGLIDVHQTISITTNLEGQDISHLDNLNINLKSEKTEDKHSIRFISDDGKGVSDSKIMLQAMVKAKAKDIIVISHAESPELSEIDMRLAENTMTWRDISLAAFTGCRLHMAHVSTKEAMEYIIQAKRSGNKVTCEVTPHHLALADEVQYRVNPPIRKQEDVECLIKAIKEGYVDSIATDHAPHTIEDKIAGAPGISGIETSFSLCYTTLVDSGEITLNKLSEIMSMRPAEIMGIKKGKISIGYDGDLVLIDTKKEFEIKTEDFASKGKNTPFQGRRVKGEVLLTVKAGKVVYTKEEII